MIAWVIAPQVPTLPVWTTLLAAGVLVWRGWLAWRSRPLPSRWISSGLLAPLAVAGTVFSHGTFVGREAGVTLVIALLALKTLELRARRDALVIFFLGFFTMISSFFYSQSLLTAAAMLLALLGMLTALVNAHMPVGRPPRAGVSHRVHHGAAGGAHHGGAVHAVPAHGAAVGYARRSDGGPHGAVGVHAKWARLPNLR